MTFFHYVLLALAAMVIVALSAYAAYLWQQLFYQRKQQQALRERVQQQRLEWLESIKIIANVLVQEQANVTECAIRIKTLMDRYYNNDCPKPEFRPIYELAWATAHMPILDQRKQFSRQQIQAFDDEREDLEEQMGDEVRLAAKAVLSYEFEKNR